MFWWNSLSPLHFLKDPWHTSHNVQILLPQTSNVVWWQTLSCSLQGYFYTSSIHHEQVQHLFFFFFWKRFIIKFWWNLIYFDLIWFGMFLPKWMSGEPCSFCSFFTFFILRFFIFLIFFLYVIVVILRCVFQEKLPQKSIDVRKSQSESLFHCWLFF